MNTYTVALARSYLVTIQAENENMAKRCSEFFLGNLADLSTEKDREEYKFQIDEIEMVCNDAIDIME